MKVTRSLTKKLLAAAGVATVVGLSFSLPAGATTTPPPPAAAAQQQAAATQRTEATTLMNIVKAGNAEIQADQVEKPLTTSLAALTSDTTRLEGQLQSAVVPKQASGNVHSLLNSYYKLGYDAAALEPVVGTTDLSLAETLNDQVLADETVSSDAAIQTVSGLNPLTQPPATAPATTTAATAKKSATQQTTETGWRNSAFVLNVVHPVVAVGWKVLIVLTAISVLFMIRRLLRPAHGLRP